MSSLWMVALIHALTVTTKEQIYALTVTLTLLIHALTVTHHAAKPLPPLGREGSTCS